MVSKNPPMEGVLTCKPHPQINEKSRKKFGQTSRYDTDCVVSAASLQHLGRRGDYLGKEGKGRGRLLACCIPVVMERWTNCEDHLALFQEFFGQFLTRSITTSNQAGVMALVFPVLAISLSVVHCVYVLAGVFMVSGGIFALHCSILASSYSSHTTTSRTLIRNPDERKETMAHPSAPCRGGAF
jgi:hypothetical protein